MSSRKAKAPRKLSPWEQIEQNSARMCKKAVHKAKCSNGQRALKIKPTVTGIVFVPRAGSQ